MKKRILIVGSDQILIDKLEGVISTNAILDCADNLDEAIRLCRMHDYDLITLRHQTTGESGQQGIGTAEQIRKIERQYFTKIILLADKPGPGTEVEAYGAGIDEIIEETASPHQLREMIRPYSQ